MSKRDPSPKPVALPSLHEKLDSAVSACKYWYGIVNDPSQTTHKITQLQTVVDDCMKKIAHLQIEQNRAPVELEKYQKLVADLEMRLAEDRKLKAEPKIKNLAASLKKNLSSLEDVDVTQLGITEEQLAKMRAIVAAIKV